MNTQNFVRQIVMMVLRNGLQQVLNRQTDKLTGGQSNRRGSPDGSNGKSGFDRGLIRQARQIARLSRRIKF